MSSHHCIRTQVRSDSRERRSDSRERSLNPEEKVALYGHQLHRYRNYLQQARDQGKERTFTPPLPKTQKNKEAFEDVEVAAVPVANAADPGSSELDEQVIKSVSNKMQKKQDFS